MRKKFSFDINAAIPFAWDVIWASHRKERKKDEAYAKKYGKKPYGWERTYYTTASDVERMVRDLAQDTAEGKPWRTENTCSGWNTVRISGNLKGKVRSWLLRGNGGKIVYHNFGRGHISGARFRPVGEPLAEAEKKTIEFHKKRRAGELPPRPIHFSQNGLLCQKARLKGRFSWHRSTARSTKDQEKVTCKQCLNLIKRAPHLIKQKDPDIGLGSISHMPDDHTHN